MTGKPRGPQGDGSGDPDPNLPRRDDDTDGGSPQRRGPAAVDNIRDSQDAMWQEAGQGTPGMGQGGAGQTPGTGPPRGMDNASDASFQTVLHNEQEILDGNTNHLIPGMDPRTPEGSDALADYLDDMYQTPSTPLANGSGEAWYDPDRGVIIIRTYSDTNPGGSVYQAPYSYFQRKTGQSQ